MIFLHIPGETRKAMDLMNRRILRLAIPNIISNITIPLLGMVDTAIAGRLGDGAAAIGAIGIGTTIFNMIYWTCGFLRMGTSGITAQAYGARNLRECTDILVRSMSVAIVLALLLVLLRNPVGRFSLGLMQGSEGARALAAEYFFARIWAAPASISLFAIHGWFIGMQNSKTPMVVSIISNVVNVVFSALFVFRFDMGIAGAALATALSQLVSFLILGWQFLHGRSIVRLRLQAVSRSPRDYGQILLIGFPTICRQGFASLSSALLNNAAAAYSDAAVAAVTISNKVYLLVRSMIIGIGQGFQPVAGYNFGAGSKPRTRQAFWFSTLFGTVVCVAGAALVALFPEQIMHFFRDDPEVTRIGRQALLYACAVMPVMAYSTYVNQLYQCLGFHQAATLLASCRNGLLYVPLILLLPGLLGLSGVAMSQPAADLLTFLVSILFQIWFFRHRLNK